MILVLAAGLAIGVFFMSKNISGYETDKRLFDLGDVSAENQGGNYKRDFDFFFTLAADKYGVPFALLKAHAIMESSLKANAFVNENPTNRSDRQGWASRGLMQVLWWPRSERFQKYGWPDSKLGDDGSKMFEPEVGIDIAAQLIRDNLNACRGNLRDAINMYNTGKKEAQFKAPNNYVDRVLQYYNTLING